MPRLSHQTQDLLPAGPAHPPAGPPPRTCLSTYCVHRTTSQLETKHRAVGQDALCDLGRSRSSVSAASPAEGVATVPPPGSVRDWVLMAKGHDLLPWAVTSPPRGVGQHPPPCAAFSCVSDALRGPRTQHRGAALRRGTWVQAPPGPSSSCLFPGARGLEGQTSPFLLRLSASGRSWKCSFSGKRSVSCTFSMRRNRENPPGERGDCTAAKGPFATKTEQP